MANVLIATPDSSSHRERPFADADERGAVMVMGLFLALAAVAGMWCLIGIGDAIVARDISQEATDSAAFTNAVVHARGMNVISFINMVLMALVMAYLTLSWLDLIVSSILTLIGVNGGVPNNCYFRYVSYVFDVPVPWCKVAKPLEKASRTLLKFDRRVFDLFERIAPPLFETQVWVAQLTPYLGSVSAGIVGAEYGRFSLSLSTSSFPGGGAIRPLNRAMFLDKIPAFTQRPGAVGRTRQGHNIYPPGVDPAKQQGDANVFQDRRIGLPVESEPAYFMCIRGARFPLEWVKDTIAGLGNTNGESWAQVTSSEPLSSVLYATFQSVGEYNRMLFCSEKKQEVPDFLRSAAAVRAMFGASRDALQARRDALKALLSLAGPNNEGLRFLFYVALLQPLSSEPINEKFYLESRYLWRMNWPDPMGRSRKRDDDGYFAGPKRVPAYAYNGSDWMQIWAVTPASPPDSSAANRIVSMPSRIFGGSTGEPSNPGTQYFLSQAEFYFDCTSNWLSSQCNKGAVASYQIKWKARLRRVHSPDIVAALVEQFANNFLFGTVFKRVTKGWTEQLIGSQVAREGIIKALRNNAAKYGNGNLTEDRSSDVYLH